jgi:signal transduction histidine kinase
MLGLQTALWASLGLILTVIWALGGGTYFWPGWVWLGAAVAVALHAVIHNAAVAEPSPRRWLDLDVGLSAIVAAVTVVIWALLGGPFWPIWPILGVGAVVAVHAAFVLRPGGSRERELSVRVDELTRTRSGALDVQATQLRRIERDLHDGAQARLVALSMLMGRAEERLEDRPEVADLVREARGEATAAIAELRDLARGIAPPVLADRGLAAAVEALGSRSPTPVVVTAELEPRLTPAIETAAYFVVAESLTNVAKHSGGAPARVQISRNEERLVVEISDDGPGGADDSAPGLAGLRRRVEALDGTLTVASPTGRGTTVRAELPCGS